MLWVCSAYLAPRYWLRKKITAPVIADGTQVTPAQSPLDDKVIDKFARTFVGEMLDFNRKTYRSSQVKAMSHMSSSALEKYWKETHFPLTPGQLNANPNEQTLMITNVTQERLNATEKDVDIFAELVTLNNKVSSPIHLKLKVAETADNEIEIQELLDLTDSKK